MTYIKTFIKTNGFHLQVFSFFFLQCFSKHRPSGQMLSISLNVHMCVHLSVHFLRYRLTVILPPLPEVRMSNIFRDSESLGKSNGKKWSHI